MMNNPYYVPGYPTPGYPPTAFAGYQTGIVPLQPTTPALLPIEQSYIENILRMNLGKMVTIYMTFENNPKWNARVFRGRLEAAGRDHIIISDPETDERHLLLMVNLDYITFEEPLEYFTTEPSIISSPYPFAPGLPGSPLTTMPPR